MLASPVPKFHRRFSALGRPSLFSPGAGSSAVQQRILQLMVCICGIAVLFWSFIDNRFRDAEGYLTRDFCLPLTIGIALVIWGIAAVGSMKKAISWFVLALIGQAVTLQLIDAGSLLRYQHYQSLPRILFQTSPVVLIFLAVQTVLVVAAVSTRRRGIVEWFKRNFRAWQLLIGITALVLTSTALSRDARSFLGELPVAVYLQLLNFANMVVAVWSIPNEARKRVTSNLEAVWEKVGSRTKDKANHVSKFALVAALWVFIVAAALNYFSYQMHPHIADEVAYLYQARYFAGGMLHLTVPDNPESFEIPLMDSANEHWYSVFPPGWPMVLAIGVLLNAAWLVNPLLGGLNVLLAYSLIDRLYDRRTATLTVLLMCVSPWNVFMNMSFMSHSLTLTCALAASILFLRCRSTRRARWAAVAGAVVGFTALIRPLDGAILAAFLVLCALLSSGIKLKLSSVAAFIISTVIVGATVLPYNYQLTGDATTLPVNRYFDKHYGINSNAFGFGSERGAGWPIDAFPGHSPLEGLLNGALNAFSVNIELFGWASGSLIVLVLFVLRRRLQGMDLLMLLLIAIIFGAHFFYYFNGGPDFGARYWYLMLVPLVVLTARGIQLLESTFAKPTPSSKLLSHVTAGLVLAALCTVINYFPWRAIDKYHHYWGMRPDVQRLASQHGFGRSLVLVRGNNFPDYASAAVYNPVDFQSNSPVYAWDRDAETRRKLLKSYPDRPVWVLNGPSLTNGGYNIVAGPISPDQFAAIAE